MGDGRWRQHAGCLGEFRMVRIAGGPGERQLPGTAKLAGAEGHGERLQIVVGGCWRAPSFRGGSGARRH